ncbi:hypothetical protein SERLADRAFT_405916 [Serpula lacrymans var. lacrymans S7.9]|uniref:Uncharacterized protein n=1 Tax=Serpula lacrymans var. lacrymans (strain S7.9) TaxID=578457 RepID=F8NK70_SERL9|nr:uncharacterized protein SERLADRAFT_405916 [Serpula lacrymans var. lacrymans S7.9]EGO28336.1 hypothetical protein SERLADRAFT_405916 [Serpula lacrymans var. lacrymans S7.9]
MQLYPVFTSKICETCHTAKVVQGIKPELQVPMWADGHTHYLLGELSQLSNRQLVIPVRWFKLTDNGPVYSEEIPVTHDSIAQVNLVHADRSLVRTIGLAFVIMALSQPYKSQQAWGDDVSGNRSKQYNEHRNIYFAHANLPQKKLSQKFFLIIPSNLNYVLMWGSKATTGVESVTWAAHSKKQKQIKFTNNILNNEFCFIIFTQPGVPRTSEGTKLAVTQQIKVAALGVQEQVTVLQRQTGVKDKLAEFWIQALITKAPYLHYMVQNRNYELVITITPSLMSKHLMYIKIHPLNYYIPIYWDKTMRLEASSIDGLTIPPIRASYMIQYRNSLIGKHFKTLQQLAVFRLDTALVPPLVQDLWKATDKLRALLEWDEIDKMNLYLDQADLEILIANVLDIWTLIDPKQIFIKAKLHILLHIVENVRQHGPAILFATEIFECFNAIFHMSSVLSNHLAPSRDIAWSCADLERFKHIVSRGSWVSNKQDHVAAGSNDMLPKKGLSLELQNVHAKINVPH